MRLGWSGADFWIARSLRCVEMRPAH
jgi:hypothetical protein